MTQRMNFPSIPHAIESFICGVGLPVPQICLHACGAATIVKKLIHTTSFQSISHERLSLHVSWCVHSHSSFVQPFAQTRYRVHVTPDIKLVGKSFVTFCETVCIFGSKDTDMVSYITCLKAMDEVLL